VSDPAQVDAAASAVEGDLGNPAVVIHNAVGGAFGTFLEIDPQILNRNFQVNTMGLLYLARRFAPAMVAAARARSSPPATPRHCVARPFRRFNISLLRQMPSLPRRRYGSVEQNCEPSRRSTCDTRHPLGPGVMTRST